jgi:hypothetical protein
MKKLPAFTLGVEEEYQILKQEICVRICRKLLMEQSYIERTSKSRNAPVCRGSWY